MILKHFHAPKSIPSLFGHHCTKTVPKPRVDYRDNHRLMEIVHREALN